MKRFIVLLAACFTPSFAELPQMSDDNKIEWLGYFVGWEDSSFDFGIGADGELILHPKKRGKRAGHKGISIQYLIEEEVKGKWVRRQFAKDGGLASENEKGLDPKKPVTVVTTVTGETKVEWTHAFARGEMVVKPKLVEKKSENKIRIGMEFSLPRLYRFNQEPTERELKKKVGSDYIRATRLKDGKKIRVKFSDLEDDVTSEEFLEDGASAFEVKSIGIMGTSFVVANGAEKTGRIDVITRGPLHKSFKVRWYADMEKLGGKETFVTFAVE